VCKDGDELAVLRRACRLTDEALERLLPEVRPGVRESDLARALRRIVEDLGGDGLSFDPIVAFGEHTSRPHHTPTDRALRIGELIQFDIGVRLGGYGADLSRVAVVGKLSDPHRRLVDALVAAQQQALDAVYAGMDGRTLDTETKQAIERAGFPAYPHGLGHGIGLDAHVHEAPTLSVRYPDAQPLEEGMVFTVEPGVYLAGDAGARIEDVVAIVDGKPEILSEFPRALIELPA
jgi:Xaa-Pro aminopeptidase